MQQDLKNIATVLDQAAKTAKATQQVSQRQPISLDDAYAIQALSIQHRLDRGEKLTGYKLGFTSRAKMEQMGVHDIIWGRLTDQMQLLNDTPLIRKNYIHPRVEPEIAFLVKQRIDRTLSLDEVTDFIDGVAAALEVIDSRYENFKFSLEDVVADNCSSTAYTLGKWLSPSTAVNGLAISMQINGQEVQAGSSEAILGNPLESLVEMSRMAAKYGVTIEAGAVILAGAATSAVHLQTGDEVIATFEGLGTVKLAVGE